MAAGTRRSLTRGIGLLCLLTFARGVDAQGCIAKSSCSCEFVGKGLIDLSSLARSPGPLFLDIKPSLSSDRSVYSFNPCTGFNEGTCKNAAICQTWGGKDMFVCGKPDMANVQYQYEQITDSLSILYSGDESRVGHVRLICDPSASVPRFSAIGEAYTKNYFFELTSKCACPNLCKPLPTVPTFAPDGGDGVSTGISAGSVLLIVVFVLIIVYLIGGAVFLQQRRQATGTDLIPNKELWATLPGLVKEGVVFVISGVRSRAGGYQQHK